LRQIVQQNQQLVVKVVHGNRNGPSIVGHLGVASGSGRFVIVSSVRQLSVISGVGHLAVISGNEHIVVFSGVGHLASVFGEALDGVKGVLIYRSIGGCRFCVCSAKFKNIASYLLLSNWIF
jgi:hypothetical protein